MMPEPRWSLGRPPRRFPRAEGPADGRVGARIPILPFSVARGHISLCLSLDASDDFGRIRILEVTLARERRPPPPWGLPR